MFSLMDFLAQIKQSRTSLSRTGQERLEQLAYSKQKTNKKAKTQDCKPLASPVTVPVPCCPEAAA